MNAIQTWGVAVCIGVYLLTALVGLAGALLRKKALRTAGVRLLEISFLTNAVVIAAMWIHLGRAPFKTLYETLLLYPFCISLMSLGLIWIHKLSVLAPFSALGALACLVYAWRSPDAGFVLLPPALQSGWFVPHVVTYFIAYGGLFVSFVLAALALVASLLGRTSTVETEGGTERVIPLEDAAHYAACAGFTALSAGLAMGCAWGQGAWGAWWGWDPKENWAFISWLLYLAYFHVRLVGAPRGKAVLWLNIACFAAVIFTYLGINYLPSAQSSMHVYQ